MKFLIFWGMMFFFLLTPAHSKVVIGAKKFTESNVLAEIASALLEKEGIPTEVKQNLGSTTLCWQALRQGSIDIYPEYTGTLTRELLKKSSNLSETEIRQALQAYGLGMTEPLGFNNTYALVLLKDRAKTLGISKISELIRHPELKAGPTLEFLGRQDGWKPMVARYGLHFQSVRGMEHKLGYQALQQKEIDLKDAYATDADIALQNLQVLEDDLHFFPQYRAVFLYRLDAQAELSPILKGLAGKIDEQTMLELNAETEKTKNPRAVAREFLKKIEGSSLGFPEITKEPWLKELVHDTWVHLKLVGISLTFAVFLGLPLGIWASRPGIVSSVILSTIGLIQTIPSLALFAVLVPISWLGASFKTAVLALFLYSLLPIVRNTAAGLRSIPPELKESAAALGFKSTTRLFKVELPLALPTILSGIQTAAIINVGTAVIAAFIGSGGLGQPIQTGLALGDTARILRGAGCAAFLALIVQFFFEGIERVLIPQHMRERKTFE